MEEKKQIDEILGELYEFARERYDEPLYNVNSPKDKWKKTGERAVLADLLRFVKELKKKYGE